MRYSDEVLCAGGVASSHEDRNEPLGRLSMMPLRRVAHQSVPGQLPMNGEHSTPCVHLCFTRSVCRIVRAAIVRFGPAARLVVRPSVRSPPVAAQEAKVSREEQWPPKSKMFCTRRGMDLSWYLVNLRCFEKRYLCI